MTNIIGTAANDVLAGTSANEAIYGLDGDDVITGGGGSDTIDGGSGDDLIVAGDGNDHLQGGDGADQLYGHGGDDIIVGGAGADVIDGGAGYDRASYADNTTGITVDLTTGTSSDGDQFTSIEGVIGGSGDDDINGNDGDNIIDGGLGADVINGGLGFDTITFAGRTTSVTVDLAAGATSDGDTLTSIEAATGGDADDSLTGDTGNNVLDGGLGADALDGGGGNDYVSYAYRLTAVAANLATGANTDGDTFTSIENLIGGWGDDTLTGDAGSNILSGGAGADTIDGGHGDDILNGGDGADTIDGGAGIDTLTYADAGAGMRIDLATGEAGEGNIAGFTAGAPLDQISNVEAVIGSAYNDTILSIDGASIDSGLGDDFLVSSAGVDAFTGNSGVDGVIYLFAGGGVTVNLALGAGMAGEAAGDTYDTIENVYGSQFDDILTGNDGANLLAGYGGDDDIRGGLGDDSLYGGAGADRIDGGDGIDTFSANDAQAGMTIDLAAGTTSDLDVLISIENAIGSSYNDVVRGDDGDNRLNGNDGDDILTGGLGADVLVGGDGFDYASYEDRTTGITVNLGATEGNEDRFSAIEGLIGGSGDDILNGTSIDNIFEGGDGDDRLAGANGDDILRGGTGDDLLRGGNGADRLEGGSGSDTASYVEQTGSLTIDLVAGTSSEGDQLVSVENVIGGQSGDTITGDAGANRLNGHYGNDTLVGGAGDDVLIGNTGRDIMTGGDGADRFVFQTLSESNAGIDARDRVMDLDIAAGDRIDFSTLDINPSTTVHETLTYIGSGAYSGSAGEVRIAASANAGYTTVGIDTDGDGISNFLIEVALPVADFSADAFLL